MMVTVIRHLREIMLGTDWLMSPSLFGGLRMDIHSRWQRLLLTQVDVTSSLISGLVCSTCRWTLKVIYTVQLFLVAISLGPMVGLRWGK